MSINHSHLTAKERDKLSFPTQWLLRHHYIQGKVLDFGCGLGADVRGLREKGFEVTAYDPYYAKSYPEGRYDTIICQYVFNVLELDYQERLLLHISSLLAPGGKAYISVRRDIRYEGFRMHKLHQKTTYQRLVSLSFPSVFNNDFCEIYKVERKADSEGKEPCIFCRPSKKLEYIAESSHTFAVYDAYPVSPGHALVIPKAHIADYFDITKTVQEELWQTVNFVKGFLQKKYSPDGFNVGININEAAGQSVFHCHIHIIPRYSGDVQHPKGGVRHIIPGKGYY